MTRDVLVSILGTQFDIDEQEAIELVTVATYYKRNGKHYILYEEQPEDHGPITKSTLKFNETSFEMMKKGGTTAHLLFDPEQSTSTYYQTPAGPMVVNVTTESYECTEEENVMHIRIRYSLDVNYNFVSNCAIDISIGAR